MTNEEAIRIISAAQGECEWNAPMDYQIAFDMAIEALQKHMNRVIIVNKEIMSVAQSLAMSYLQGAIRDIKDDQSDTRNYFKIYCDSEPNEIAEKIYQMCGSREKMIKVWEEIGEYIESESEETTDDAD